MGVFRKNDDRMSIYALYQVMVEMMVNYYKPVRNQLENILVNSKILNHVTNDLLTKTDQFYSSLNFDINANYKNSKHFQAYLTWMKAFREEKLIIVTTQIPSLDEIKKT